MNAYTRHLKEQEPPVKQQIMKILGWSEQDYSDFQWRMGTLYLQYYIPNDPAGIDMLVESKIFWNWWKNHWIFRDTAFAKTIVGDCHKGTAMAIYYNLHHPDHLIGTIRPNAAVLHDGYAKMINEFQNNLK